LCLVKIIKIKCIQFQRKLVFAKQLVILSITYWRQSDSFSLLSYQQQWQLFKKEDAQMELVKEWKNKTNGIIVIQIVNYQTI
jgi:hypothetical protein